MVDLLKGKRFIIGREAEKGGLLVADVSSGKAALVPGIPVVPSSVSRCQPQSGVAHLQLEIGHDGNIIVSNLKQSNTTYVNGLSIASKRIHGTDTLELGPQRYAVDINNILLVASKISNKSKQKEVVPPVPPGQDTAYSIAHLQGVWNAFNEGKKGIAARQRRVNMIRAGSALFTMCAMPSIVIFEDRAIGLALTGVGIVGNVISFLGLKKENAAESMDKLTEEFQDNFVCPKCGKFLGNMSYKLMKKQTGMSCPYCKVKYQE